MTRGPSVAGNGNGGSSKETMTHIVSEYLRNQIISGELKPGERIRQEELAEACGTSRIPVREALHRLQAEGLVSMVAHAGARVASMSVADIHEVYLIRERLEPIAVERSVPLLTAEDKSQLHHLMEQLEHASAIGDVAAWIEYNRAFHRISMSRAEMPRASRLIEDMWNASQAYRHLNTFLPGRTAVAQLEHRLLLVSIDSGNAEWARDVVSTHIRRTRKDLERRSQLVDDAAEPVAAPTRTRRSRTASVPS